MSRPVTLQEKLATQEADIPLTSLAGPDEDMTEDKSKKEEEQDEIVTDDSTEVLLSHEVKQSSSLAFLCLPNLQTFLKSYRSNDPQSRITPFAVVLLVVISIIYVLNQADRLVLAVLIPSGLKCINGGENGTNNTCINEDHDSQLDNLNISDCISFNNAQQGLITGPAFTIVYVLAGLPLAWLADTASRPLVFLGGIVFWSAMVILMGFIHKFWELLLLRIMLGVGEVVFQLGL